MNLTQVNKFPNVFKEQKGKWSNYFVKGNKPYFGERVLKNRDGKFRAVDPERSKLFAAIAAGISQIGFKEDSSVLYLGASHGFTVSYLLDMVKQGEIYALDFAPRVVRDLIFIAQARDNVAPLMADANQPQTYKEFVPEVDVIFMDIAQRNQVEIFAKNIDMFLKDDGFGLLALKARSVDVTRKPQDIFREVKIELEKMYNVVDYRELDPYEKDHAFYVIKKRKAGEAPSTKTFDKPKPSFDKSKKSFDAPKKSFNNFSAGKKNSSYSKPKSSYGGKRESGSSYGDKRESGSSFGKKREGSFSGSRGRKRTGGSSDRSRDSKKPNYRR